MKFYKLLKKQITAVMMLAAGMLATTNVYALSALGSKSTAVGYAESKAFGLWLIGLLTGPLGFALAAVAFFMGCWMYFQKQQLWATMGCVAFAIIIQIVPRVLQSFFSI